MHPKVPRYLLLSLALLAVLGIPLLGQQGSVAAWEPSEDAGQEPARVQEPQLQPPAQLPPVPDVNLPPVEIDQPSELPEELAFLVNPKIVPYSELTDEILKREAERTTAENALVVRYPRKEFERLFADIRPLQEQDWWRETTGGVGPEEEYLSATKLAGRTYLATVEQEDSVYTTKLCYPLNPELKKCYVVPGRDICRCFILPDPDQYPPNDGGGTDFPRDPEVACEADFWRSPGEPCRERTACDALLGCRSSRVHVAVPGMACVCSDPNGLGGSGRN